MNNRTKRMSARRPLALTVRRSSPLVAVLLLACACATPIGVTHDDVQATAASWKQQTLLGC
jgi:hypothetical protein